jgi:hypothetical protein
MLTDLLASKKFRVLLALVALWSKPVHEALAIEGTALPWLTLAFATFFIAQGLSDLGGGIAQAKFRIEEEEIEEPPVVQKVEKTS